MRRQLRDLASDPSHVIRVGQARRYRHVRVYSVTARLILVARKLAVPVALDRVDIRAFEDSVLSVADVRSRRQMHVLFENLPTPPRTYPAFSPEIRIDDAFNV